MKKVLVTIGLIIFATALLVLNILNSGGFFRTVDPGFNGSISRTLSVYGAEDLAVSREDSFLIISSDDRAARFHDRKHKGHLLKLNLRNPEAKPEILTDQLTIPFYPHGITMWKMDSAVYKIWTINHPLDEHTIEVFTLFGDSLVHQETIADPNLVRPNDLVAVDENSFYFTNDHQFAAGWKRIAEDYLGLALSDVRFYDGEKFTKVADDIAYANGINYDQNRNLLFVASPRDFLVKVFQPDQTSGQLTFIEDIDAGTGVDNIEFDESGKLWIGCHPNLFAFTRYAAGKSYNSPSEIITIDYQSKGDYLVESIFVDEGEIISASTIAVPFDGKVYIGSVMDDELVVWERN